MTSIPRFACALLATACFLLSAGARAEGALVIVGGALRADNAVVWERIVALAGGKGARIAVIPAAAGDPLRSGAHAAATLQRYGADAFVLALAPRLPGDVHAAANSAALAAQLRQAGGVYFVGGDQARITAALRNPDGSDTVALGEIWQLYRRGGVVAGTSAGAAIMSSTMFDNARSVLETLQYGVKQGAELAPGLGFIGKDVFVDQHLLVRGRFARMLPAMLKMSYSKGLGIDENTAVVVGPARQAEVIGYRGALWIDTAAAGVDGAASAFNISNVSISYLDHGDRIDLASGRITPSADKRDGAYDQAHPSGTTPVYAADILGNGTVVDMMCAIADSSQPQATGLAFGGPGADPARPGFVFTLRRTARTEAYESATSEACSVYHLRLDVQPAPLRWPGLP